MNATTQKNTGFTKPAPQSKMTMTLPHTGNAAYTINLTLHNQTLQTKFQQEIKYGYAKYATKESLTIKLHMNAMTQKNTGSTKPAPQSKMTTTSPYTGNAPYTINLTPHNQTLQTKSQQKRRTRTHTQHSQNKQLKTKTQLQNRTQSQTKLVQLTTELTETTQQTQTNHSHQICPSFR